MTEKAKSENELSNFLLKFKENPQVTSPRQPQEAQQPREVYQSPKKSRMLNFGWRGIRMSKEHVHSQITVKIKLCKDCGAILSGGEKEK